MTPFFRVTTLTLLLSFSGSLYADAKKIYRPARKIELNAAQLAAETARREAVLKRTQQIISLFGAEIALNQGDFNSAMNLYLSNLRETKDPEVAGRAMELAIDARAYSLAEAVYQEWRKIEPNPGPTQRRLALMRALALGDATLSIPAIQPVMQEATQLQRARLFLLLAQMGILHEDLLQKGAKTVHKVAQEYHSLAEANIADVIYSMGSKNQSNVFEALTHLAQNDPELSPQSQLVLGMVAQKQPEMLNQFFAQQNKTLSENWRLVFIQSLIQTKHYAEAKQSIHELLNNNPSARLYFQAAILSMNMEKDSPDTERYLEKAYQVGNSDEQSRAALMLAIKYSQQHDLPKAELWAKRVVAPSFQFDQTVLLASIASQQKQWTLAKQLVDAAEKMPQRVGTTFGQYDLQQVKLYVVSETQTPQQALNSITRALQAAKKLVDESERKALISQALYQRGLLYADKLRQIELAISDLKQYVLLNPNNAMGLNALGYTMLSGSEKGYDEAFTLIQAAYQQESDNPQFNDSLGWAYHKKGDNQTALPYLEFAYEHEPDPEVAAHLGEVYWLLNRQDDAKRIWREGWQKNPQHHVLKETLKRYQIVF